MRNAAWTAAQRKTNKELFEATLSGDKEDLVTSAERLAKDVRTAPPGAAARQQRKPDTVHDCFRHFFGKCDLAGRNRTCTFHHECPFCSKAAEGCLDNHLRPLGLTTIRMKDKKGLEDRASKGGGKGAGPSWSGHPWPGQRGARFDDRGDHGQGDRGRSRSRGRGGPRQQVQG